MTQAKEACRRWTFEVARIRARAAKMSRRASQQPDEAPEIVEQALAACDVLIRELAASVETCDLATAGVRTQMALTDHLFQRMPIACGAIDREGLIINANQAASSLLNVSVKHLEGRMLLHFAEDRPAFMAFLAAVRVEPEVQRVVLTLRPRERASVNVHICSIPSRPVDPTTWLWFMEPEVRRVESRKGAPLTDANPSLSV
jgi:PAS domain-containing protein